MKEEITRIENLLERFYDGLTSNEDEQELYRFFGRDDIPAELLSHKPVIQYFETGLADEFTCVEEEQTDTQKDAKKLRMEPKTFAISHLFERKRWIFWSSVAASFLLILFTSIYFLSTEDPYAGSYIIRNGVRITDLELIKPELEAAIQKSLLIEQEAERLIERLSVIDDSQEAQIMQLMQEHNQRILDNTHDDNIRNEIEEILNPNL